jgi:phosphatidylglycerophosphatase A
MTPLQSSQAPYITRPSARFMLTHPAHWIAQGFGSGLSPILPGTFGTLLGWLSYVVFTLRWPEFFTPLHWTGIIVAGFLLGVWSCSKTGKDLGISDHGSMVWDEIIAFWLVLIFVMPAGFWTQFCAFILFRIFDMAKPAPVGYVDKHLKGGFGVMADDIVASFYTLLSFAVWRAI